MSKEKVPGPDGFTGDFYQMLKKKLSQFFYNLFQKSEAKETFPNSVYETSMTLMPKKQRHYMNGKLD